MLGCLGSAGKAHSNGSSDLSTRLDEPEQHLLQGTVALVGCVWPAQQGLSVLAALRRAVQQ